MDLQQYVKDATRTESKVEALHVDPVILGRVFNAFIASGTLLDMIKKNAFYNKPINPEKWNINVQKLESAGRLLNEDNLGITTSYNEWMTLTVDPRIFHSVVGIATEATELVEAIHTNDPINHTNLREEVGDICWYIAIMMDTLGADWENILKTNIAKLRERYPDKFTSENAIERNLEAERKILEGKPVNHVDINFIETQ